MKKSLLAFVLILSALFLIGCGTLGDTIPHSKYKMGDRVRFVLDLEKTGIVTAVLISSRDMEGFNSYRVRYVESETPGMTTFAENWFESGELVPYGLVNPSGEVPENTNLPTEDSNDN